MRYTHDKMRVALGVLFMVGGVWFGLATTYYVAPGGNDSNDGLGWSTAKATIAGGVAVATVAGDEVVVSNGTYQLSAEITVSRAITVRGYTGNPDDVIVDGQDTVRCFTVTGAATIRDMTITRGRSSWGAGANVSAGATFLNCVFVANTVTDGGGAVRLNHASALLVDSVIVSNTALNGGGVWQDNGTIRGCTFVQNRAGNYGGGVYLMTGLIDDCILTSNATTSLDGGGLSINGGTVTNSQILANNAGRYGGGARQNSAASLLVDCIINYNIATNSPTFSEGGGVYLDNGTIRNCTFIGNKAYRHGGAVQFLNGLVEGSSMTSNSVSHFDGGAVQIVSGTLSNSVMVANTAGRNAGGVRITGSGGRMIDCQLVGNEALGASAQGGGAVVDNGSVINCLFEGNVARSEGGAVHINNGLVDRSRMIHNVTLVNDGGAVRQAGGTVRNALMVGNQAQRGGGAVRMTGGAMHNCTVVGNRAVGSGGDFEYSTTTLTLTNMIVYANSPNNGQRPGFAYSILDYATTPSGPGNTNAAPLFVDGGSGYGTTHVIGVYELTRNSPARNQGVFMDWMTGAHDLAGNVRISEDVVDIGAYEFYPQPPGQTLICIR